MPKKRLIRAWLILKIKGTNKVVIMKRSKKSNNPRQWDFIGGSTRRKRVNPGKLIRKESIEEIGLPLMKMTLEKMVYAKDSMYYYYTSEISRKQFNSLQLNYEHSKIKLLAMNKLVKKKRKRLHHSILIYIKNINS